MNPRLKIFVHKRGSVGVKINFGTDCFRCYVGDGRHIRKNTDDDRDLYPYVIHPYDHDVLARTLYATGIKEGDVWIDPDSVDRVYQFKRYDGRRETSTTLNSRFVNMWWESDCPELIRYTVNKSREVDYGARYIPICWRKVLIGSSVCSAQITDDEIEALSRDREHLRLAKELKSFQEARSRGKYEEKKRPKRVDWVTHPAFVDAFNAFMAFYRHIEECSRCRSLQISLGKGYCCVEAWSLFEFAENKYVEIEAGLKDGQEADQGTMSVSKSVRLASGTPESTQLMFPGVEEA